MPGETITCTVCGKNKPVDEFYINSSRGVISREKRCKECRRNQSSARYAKQTEKRKSAPKPVYPKDESDLVPMVAGGFARWAVISSERRAAFGEISTHWGIGDDL